MKRIALLLVMCLTVCASAEKFKGLAPTPPMGWNSWNTFAMKIDENLVKETAEALIASGMRDAGYNYIVIDDGWEAMERDTQGNLVPDPNKFPSGMKALGDYLHSKGFKFGIHNCAGTKTCSGFPGGRGHEFQDALTYASWGVDYLKYDWCYHGTANAEETYRTMGNALYATGRPIVFSLCEWGSNKPWEWAQDIGHLWRTTGDITNCYDCQETYSLGWKYILKSQIGLEKYAGPDHWNDPDMLEVGNKGLTLAESRAHFSLWCIIAAPLMAGNDVRHMSNDVCDILTNKEVIAVDQDPLGKQGYQFMDHPGKQIWVKELSNGCWAVCFFNNSDEAVKLRINWANFPFVSGNYEIRDLWKKKNVGTTGKNFEDKVDPLDVILVKLTPVKKDK
ncbi:MAG: glycoside hydrolase family 27 protein [Sedimentisphaerales bacterium]